MACEGESIDIAELEFVVGASGFANALQSGEPNLLDL